MDIFPTIADIVGIDELDMITPIDGISLLPMMNSKLEKREIKIPFRFRDKGALIDNNFKLIVTSLTNQQFELYDLENDPKESNNLADTKSELFGTMKKDYIKWSLSVDSSVLGRDYPENILFDQPERHFWMKDDRYKPYLKEFVKRPEYEKRIKRSK
jgi:hypothetical protein